MNRRALIKAGLLAAGALALGGHTPYKQWVVYRQKHLLIGSHRQDPRTYDLAQQAVDHLDEHLPAAKARVARAPNVGRLASLLGTGQMDVAILSKAHALGMLDGVGEFKPYGPVALRLLVPIGDRLLVSRADLLNRHAWLVAKALIGTDLVAVRDTFSTKRRPDWHAGSHAAIEGRPEPSASGDP